jgi:hypothetical protein
MILLYFFLFETNFTYALNLFRNILGIRILGFHFIVQIEFNR